MDYKLRKCPFCGGEGYIDVYDMPGFDKIHVEGNNGVYYSVVCGDCCSTTGNYTTIDEAVESWNKRYRNGIDIVHCKECIHSNWIQEPCHGKVEYHCKKLKSVVDKYFFCGAGVEREVMPNGNQ